MFPVRVRIWGRALHEPERRAPARLFDSHRAHAERELGAPTAKTGTKVPFHGRNWPKSTDCVGTEVRLLGIPRGCYDLGRDTQQRSANETNHKPESLSPGPMDLIGQRRRQHLGGPAARTLLERAGIQRAPERGGATYHRSPSQAPHARTGATLRRPI